MITFSELINNVEFDDGLLVRVWDEESETYLMDYANYDELTEEKRNLLKNLEVTHIYPYSIPPYSAVVVELRW